MFSTDFTELKRRRWEQADILGARSNISTSEGVALKLLRLWRFSVQR